MRLAQGQVRRVVADHPHRPDDEMLSDPDTEKAQRAMQAMLSMGKLDIAELQRAAEAA